MKIALTHAYCLLDVRRGAERVVDETARALVRRGHDVTVLTASASAPGRAREHGARVVRLRRLRRTAEGHERDFGLRVLPHLLAGGYDAVHALGVRDAVAALRARRLGRVGRVLYQNVGIPLREWWDTRPEAADHRRVVEEADVYGCLSQYAMDALAAGYGRTGDLVPGGVNLEVFRPGAPREPDPVVLFSGAIAEPRKGVPDLLRAVALVAEVEPAIRLWLSGQGDPAPLLAAAPEAARERTTVLPRRPPGEMADEYGRAWVTALPSTNEAFGLALVESLACGTPVVGTDHAALPELVTPATGALAAPNDDESLAAAITTALALARDEATAGRCRAFAERYDWETGLAPRLERLYAGG